MDLGLNNKVALVAAASRGLGRAVAEELAAEGASLIICSRKQETIERVANEIKDATGANIVGVAADVSNPSDVSRLVEAGIERFGRIDILVTNAGGPPAGQFESFNLEHWEAAARLLLHSAVELARQVLPGMKERRWGRILNITSSAVKAPMPLLGLSTGARSGLTGFTATLAREIAPDGVTVNNLLPGNFDTDRLTSYVARLAESRGISQEEARQSLAAQTPAGRMGRPEEFGALCAFLASEHAGFITGQNILIDGGTYPGVF